MHAGNTQGLDSSRLAVCFSAIILTAGVEYSFLCFTVYVLCIEILGAVSLTHFFHAASATFEKARQILNFDDLDGRGSVGFLILFVIHSYSPTT